MLMIMIHAIPRRWWPGWYLATAGVAETRATAFRRNISDGVSISIQLTNDSTPACASLCCACPAAGLIRRTWRPPCTDRSCPSHHVTSRHERRAAYFDFGSVRRSRVARWTGPCSFASLIWLKISRTSCMRFCFVLFFLMRE